jgi:transcriptional regulator with XRE-family HTH domain
MASVNEPMYTIAMLDLHKLRARREELGLTQEQAAKAAGMSSRQAWNNVESGRQSPTLETLDRIAKALKMKARDLVK